MSAALQLAHCLAHPGGSCRQSGVAFGCRAQVLRSAVVGLQAGEPQRGVLPNLVSQRNRRPARSHAAAALTDVDLDKNIDGVQAVSLGLLQRLRKPFDAQRAVDRDGESGGGSRGRPAASRASLTVASTSLVM